MSFDFKFSTFGEKLEQKGGIVDLMQDLGKALNGQTSMRMMGGGNPAAIPEVQSIWRKRTVELLSEENNFNSTLVNYDPPSGNPKYLSAVAKSLNHEYGWNLKSKNIAVTSGAQTAFFFLFNILAGKFANGQQKKILLPLAPEYIGYANQGITQNIFVAQPAIIEEKGKNQFKYHVDFKQLKIDDEIAAICVSRPTNPSGNVLTDQEINQLSEISRSKNIPLIIDNAYGNPFPGAIFTEATPIWDEHIILTLSLSKLGLPGTRTGIVIGSEKIIAAITAANAIVGLANNNIGQALSLPLIESGELITMSKNLIKPFYKDRMLRARSYVEDAFGDTIPYKLHESEGAFFLWFWFPGLPITTIKLYEKLKKRNVLVVPGEYFFFGSAEQWDHSHECIRVTFSQSDNIVKEGIQIIADEVAKSYGI